MTLLDFPTSYNQLGTPSTSGLVNVYASPWDGSGTVLSSALGPDNFIQVQLPSTNIGSGLNFLSINNYEPSGGFQEFNSSSGSLYGLPFDSGLLRLLPSSVASSGLTNNLVTFERPAPSKNSIATMSTNPSGTTYTYSSPSQTSSSPGGASGSGGTTKGGKEEPPMFSLDEGPGEFLIRPTSLTLYRFIKSDANDLFVRGRIDERTWRSVRDGVDLLVRRWNAGLDMGGKEDRQYWNGSGFTVKWDVMKNREFIP